MHQNTKAAVCAAIAALAVSAGAQAQSTTTVYGIADAQFERVETSGSTTPTQDKPARYRLSNVSSELGVKASMPLGDGMTGLAQYTTGINVDNASGNTSAGMFGNAKDSFVGLAIDNVGTFKLGRMTAAARWNSGTADFSPMGAGLQDDQGMLSGASGQTGLATPFNIRLDNVLAFESARFAGLSARAYFSANENKSAASTANGVALDDKSYSLGLQYVNGPFDLRLSQEQRNDKGTLNASTDHSTRDRDFRFGLRYALSADTTLALGYDRMEFTDANATGATKTSLKKTGWVLGAKHNFGKHAVYGGYGQGSDIRCSLASGAACNGADTGASNWALTYNYNFNKQMMLEAFVTQVRNKARGKYDFDSGGVGPAAGAKATGSGIGLRYAF
jgi:predicted porin